MTIVFRYWTIKLSIPLKTKKSSTSSHFTQDGQKKRNKKISDSITLTMLYSGVMIFLDLDQLLIFAHIKWAKCDWKQLRWNMSRTLGWLHIYLSIYIMHQALSAPLNFVKMHHFYLWHPMLLRYSLLDSNKIRYTELIHNFYGSKIDCNDSLPWFSDRGQLMKN